MRQVAGGVRRLTSSDSCCRRRGDESTCRSDRARQTPPFQPRRRSLVAPTESDTVDSSAEAAFPIDSSSNPTCVSPLVAPTVSDSSNASSPCVGVARLVRNLRRAIFFKDLSKISATRPTRHTPRFCRTKGPPAAVARAWAGSVRPPSPSSTRGQGRTREDARRRSECTD